MGRLISCVTLITMIIGFADVANAGQAGGVKGGGRSTKGAPDLSSLDKEALRGLARVLYKKIDRLETRIAQLEEKLKGESRARGTTRGPGRAGGSQSGDTAAPDSAKSRGRHGKLPSELLQKGESERQLRIEASRKKLSELESRLNEKNRKLARSAVRMHRAESERERKDREEAVDGFREDIDELKKSKKRVRERLKWLRDKKGRFIPAITFSPEYSGYRALQLGCSGYLIRLRSVPHRKRVIPNHLDSCRVVKVMGDGRFLAEWPADVEYNEKQHRILFRDMSTEGLTTDAIVSVKEPMRISGTTTLKRSLGRTETVFVAEPASDQ